MMTDDEWTLDRLDEELDDYFEKHLIEADYDELTSIDTYQVEFEHLVYKVFLDLFYKGYTFEQACMTVFGGSWLLSDLLDDARELSKA